MIRTESDGIGRNRNDWDIHPSAVNRIERESIAPNRCLIEQQWNTSSSLRHNPYAYSKVAAEREAWRIAGTQSQWQLVGPWLDPALNRKVISRNLGYPFCADHSKSIRDLEMQYRPFEETVVEMFQQLVDNGEL